jgi:sialate O-acetylesterase
MRLFKVPLPLVASIISLGVSSLQADVTLPNIFGDHMVLQREQANPIWGKAEAGEKVTVTIDEQSHTAVAGTDGNWRVKLDPLAVGGPYQLTVKGNNTLTFEDVLAGEVWICSGQSNMQWSLNNSNHADVEIASANYPEIRLISVPQVGTQEAQENFNGQWQDCSPRTVANFSAVGYLFGSRIHNALGVPVGLINNAWGGSAAEAWVPREVLEADDGYTELLNSWDAKVAAYTDEKHAAKVAEFKAWQAAGSPKPNKRAPRDFRAGQHRPANIFNGVLHPTIGYGMRGVIWYQGESNAGRAYQYRELFPLMISTWRDLWRQGNFPFYWVQLADFQAELDAPAESAWAELREAQTMALALTNTGEAVIIDAGEGRDIHPRDKQTVANRLARLALANDYGYNMASQSPRYASMETTGNTITLTFDHVSPAGLYTFDVKQPIGFAVAGADKVFAWADAKIVAKNKVRVSSASVPHPVAVRYAWANNPVANLQDRNGLPVTPFRTDDWPGITVNNVR